MFSQTISIWNLNLNLSLNIATLVGRQEEHPTCKNRVIGVVICLERGADCLHMVQLMPMHPETISSLASFKFRLVLPFRYRLPQVVLGKQLNGYVI